MLAVATFKIGNPFVRFVLMKTNDFTRGSARMNLQRFHGQLRPFYAFYQFIGGQPRCEQTKAESVPQVPFISIRQTHCPE